MNIKNTIWCLSIETLDCTHKGIYGVIYRSPNAKENQVRTKIREERQKRREG